MTKLRVPNLCGPSLYRDIRSQSLRDERAGVPVGKPGSLGKPSLREEQTLLRERLMIGGCPSGCRSARSFGQAFCLHIGEGNRRYFSIEALWAMGGVPLSNRLGVMDLVRLIPRLLVAAQLGRSSWARRARTVVP